VVPAHADDPASVVVPRVASTAPASASRGTAPERGTFKVEMTEDFASDPDRRKAKPRHIVDLISRLIGLDVAYTTGATFDFCRDFAGHRVAFSRRYNQDGTKPDILIDLFANEGAAVREEVDRKRAAIIAHNESAVARVEKTLADVETAVFAQVERESAQPTDRNVVTDGPLPDIELRVASAQASALLYLRREGLVPFGYLPIVGMPRDFDAAPLLAGAVLDIPPR
jgi:hypothetical protein